MRLLRQEVYFALFLFFGSGIGGIGTSPLAAQSRFLRGDVADANGILNIGDPARTLGFLFLGTPESLECQDAADANDDGFDNLSTARHK